MANHLRKLTFNSLDDLDRGRFGKVLLKHLEIIRQDCINRPVDASMKAQPRKVLVEFTFTPEARADEFGAVNLEKLVLEAKVKSKLPDNVSAPVDLKVGRDGLYFNPDFNDDLDQPALPYGTAEEDED